ncbi:hypothetical protein Tco_0576524 [Tanacetum coccineum]
MMNLKMNGWMNGIKGIPCVPKEPWSENETPIDDIHHICEPIRFKMGKLNGPLAIQMMKGFAKEENYQGWFESWGDATHGVMNFCEWLKRCFRNFHELDYELLVKLKEYWWKMNDHECSPFSNWRYHINEAYMNTNIDVNYNPYLDVSRTFKNHEGWNDEEDIHKERKPNDDDDIGNLDYGFTNKTFHGMMVIHAKRRGMETMSILKLFARRIGGIGKGVPSVGEVDSGLAFVGVDGGSRSSALNDGCAPKTRSRIGLSYMPDITQMIRTAIEFYYIA